MRSVFVVLTIVITAAAGLGIELTLLPVGSYETGVYNAGAAEIVDYHAATRWMFITNASADTVDVVSIANMRRPRLLFQIQLPGSPTAVAVHPELSMIAVSCQAEKVTDPGTVEFFMLTGQRIGAIEVGSLPDALKWTPDGRRLIVANEGEPTNTRYEATYQVLGEAGNRQVVFDEFVDPEGSVTIITLGPGLSLRAKVNAATVATADFSSFDGSEAELREAGARIFSPAPMLSREVTEIVEQDDGKYEIKWGAKLMGTAATVAQDVEPENIAISADSRTAYVTLQENNAVAVIDIEAAEVTHILGCGYKDHNHIGSGVDAANNKRIDILPWPLKAIYQPDGIALFTVGDQTYIAMANEGDIRDVESTTVGKVKLADNLVEWSINNLGQHEDGKPPLIQTADYLSALKISSLPPDGKDGTLYSELYCFGGRSFTIRALDGGLVFDSGDQFEQITAAKYPESFNTSDNKTVLDDRSDDKGCEPESLVVGVIDDCPVAFVGLERQGGIMAYDLSNPSKPRFLDYVNRRNFNVPVSIKDADGNTVANPAAGDLSMEGLLFVPADKSPSGKPLVLAAHEVSGTTTIFEVNVR
jgi:DNA-binding beta-propeller fold protein YncE